MQTKLPVTPLKRYPIFIKLPIHQANMFLIDPPNLNEKIIIIIIIIKPHIDI